MIISEIKKTMCYSRFPQCVQWLFGFCVVFISILSVWGVFFQNLKSRIHIDFSLTYWVSVQFFFNSKHFHPSIEFYNMTQVSKSSTLSLRFCNSRTLLFISFISNTLPCSQLFGRQGTHGWLLPCNRSHFVFFNTKQLREKIL